MSRTPNLLGMTLMVMVLAAGTALARGAGGKHRPRPSGGSDGAPVAIDPQEPIDWMTDYDEACKLAAGEKRALLILITTEEVERAGRTCSFAANSLRRAVRESKVVPLKLLPPMMLDTTRLTSDEAKRRQEVFRKAGERYQALAKGFGVSTVPSLVYAAPDATKLMMQSAPPDQDIAAVLGRLSEMLKANAEALAKAGGDAQPQPAEDKPKDEKPPEQDKPPKDGKPAADDF